MVALLIDTAQVSAGLVYSSSLRDHLTVPFYSGMRRRRGLFSMMAECVALCFFFLLTSDRWRKACIIFSRIVSLLTISQAITTSETPRRCRLSMSSNWIARKTFDKRWFERFGEQFYSWHVV
jgi:hypothetical protein